jgi:hypothetical protein
MRNCAQRNSIRAWEEFAGGRDDLLEGGVVFPTKPLATL